MLEIWGKNSERMWKKYVNKFKIGKTSKIGNIPFIFRSSMCRSAAYHTVIVKILCVTQYCMEKSNERVNSQPATGRGLQFNLIDT